MALRCSCASQPSFAELEKPDQGVEMTAVGGHFHQINLGRPRHLLDTLPTSPGGLPAGANVSVVNGSEVLTLVDGTKITFVGFASIPNSHIFFGSDYLGNAGSAGTVIRGLDAYTGFTAQQRQAVYRDNALKMFPRFAKACHPAAPLPTGLLGMLVSV